MSIRKEVHTRSKFASEQFNKYAYKLAMWVNYDKNNSAVNPKGSLVGKDPQHYLKKLNQSNRIWKYYSSEFGKEFKE